MPYVVTTRTLSGPGVQSIWAYSRRAVATLEEARHEAAMLADATVPDYETVDRATHDAVWSLPESGGTITLPDGTTVEVERTHWLDLKRRAGLLHRQCWNDEILAAFNAREASQ